LTENEQELIIANKYIAPAGGKKIMQKKRRKNSKKYMKKL